MKICMLAYTFYERDNRVLRYAEALANRGDAVDVIALRREGQPFAETLNVVNVYRIQRRVLNEKTRISYLLRLLAFFIRSTLFLTYLHLKFGYDVIHVHSVPDFEVFAAINNKEKLARLGDICLKERQLGYAAKAYELSGDKDRLNVLGDTCLRENLIATALKAYTLSQNDMMITFI